MCCIPKPIVKEHNIPEIKDKSNYIHEHNYSCYQCLDGIKARRELNVIYEKMKLLGIVD